MIDYLKILLTKDYELHNLLDNSLLKFTKKFDVKTSEIINTNSKGKPVKPHQIAHYQNLKFVVYDSGTIYVSGSLHKYYYNGLHNFKDFGINEIHYVLKDLENKFNIKPNQCILKNIELGININHNHKTENILSNCLLHKTKPFEYKYHSDEGKYIQCEHKQYLVKIYDKRKHYDKYFKIENEILRFELKFNRMEYFNKLGIFTLEQLLDYDLINFKDRLLTEWGNVLYFDKNTIKDEKKQLQYSSVKYWLELNPENLKYHRKQYNLMLAENPNNIKKEIAEILEKKIIELNQQTTQIDTLYILSKRVVSTSRKCIITGYDISMQKGNSKMLSHTGLRYYKKHHYHIYKEIERKYLSKLWISANDEVKIKEIAHNIRNYKSNIDARQIKLYRSNQLNLLEQLHPVKYG